MKKCTIEVVKLKPTDFSNSMTAEQVIYALSLVPKDTPIIIDKDGGELFDILRISKGDKKFVSLMFFSEDRIKQKA